MIGKLKDLTMNRDGTQNITITVQADFREEFDELADKDVSIEIKKYSVHRSMDANNYLWHLCSEIAKKTSKYSTSSKNDIYKEAIKAKGEFEPLVIRKEAVQKFLDRWAEKGIGWFAEVIDDYKDEYKIVHAFYGSSTYDSTAMSKILDYVILIANDLNIPTMTPKEKERLLIAWNKKRR